MVVASPTDRVSPGKAFCCPKYLVPSSARRVEFPETRTTETLGNTGRTSCGASYSSFASFLGTRVHDLLLLNQLSFKLGLSCIVASSFEVDDRRTRRFELPRSFAVLLASTSPLFEGSIQARVSLLEVTTERTGRKQRAQASSVAFEMCVLSGTPAGRLPQGLVRQGARVVGRLGCSKSGGT